MKIKLIDGKGKVVKEKITSNYLIRVKDNKIDFIKAWNSPKYLEKIVGLDSIKKISLEKEKNISCENCKEYNNCKKHINPQDNLNELALGCAGFKKR